MGGGGGTYHCMIPSEGEGGGGGISGYMNIYITDSQ